MYALVALTTAGTARGGWKVPASIAVALVVAAAWLTGSRAAVVAILVVTAAPLLLAVRRPGARHPGRWIGLAACVAGAVVFMAAFPNRPLGAGTNVAVQIRKEMAVISFRMLSAQPWFGVGLGEFYRASGPYIAASPLAATYRNENAHNMALQWIAESGVIGTAALGWLVWAIARRVRNGPAYAEDSRLLAGLVLALLAFAATALLGHPLLTTEVSFAFWIVVGLVIGLSSDSAQSQTRTPSVLVTLATVAILAATPWRVGAKLAQADMEHVGWGVSNWQIGQDGERFRRIAALATVFVPTGAGFAELPYRLSDEAAPTTISLWFRGKEADRLVITDHQWHRYVLRIAPRSAGAKFEPVEVRVVQGSRSGVLLGRVRPLGRGE
jgi:hypothetical protein